MSRIVPSGKHKGKSIDDLDHSTVFYLYAAWNGVEEKKKHPFFNVLVSKLEEFAAAKGRRKDAPSETTSESSQNVMPFGKHKGKRIENIDRAYLRWLVENNVAGRMKQPILQLFASTGQERPVEQPKKPKENRDLSQYNDSRTHYDWTDRNGKTHRIPNDVSMEGTEDEECPFDATPAPEYEELSDLDREFRLMFC